MTDELFDEIATKVLNEDDPVTDGNFMMTSQLSICQSFDVSCIIEVASILLMASSLWVFLIFCI